MRNKWLSVCLALLFLAVVPLTAAAQEFAPDQRGSISVSLVSKNGELPLAGAELSVFYIATVECNAEGKLIYHNTEDFAACGFRLDDPERIGKLDAFVMGNSIECRKIVTDSKGNAVCEDLPLGLYFVKQTGEVKDGAYCTPFLVTVPFETEGSYVYHVDASPKTDVVRLTDITIRKVWNTDKSEPGSDHVKVQLLRHETILNTAILNAQNNWQVIYEDMLESDSYRIVEVNVPRGYAATYSRDGYQFTVTNTPALAQTGQLVWPIPVFALAGIIFLMIGFMILRKPGKQDA